METNNWFTDRIKTKEGLEQAKAYFDNIRNRKSIEELIQFESAKEKIKELNFICKYHY